MQRFISEDDLDTFEGWLEYQAVDAAKSTPEDLALWRQIFEQREDTPKVGIIKHKRVHGEYRYAVAVRDGGQLWLTLWVKRSAKGEFFVMMPCGDRKWDPHTSYHRDGTLHMKSFGHKRFTQKRQPLSGEFQGAAHLGTYGGHGPKGVGAICDPEAYSGIFEVAPGKLGPRDGSIVVDLVEPGCDPIAWPEIVQQEVFRDTIPWVVIRIASSQA